MAWAPNIDALHREDIDNPATDAAGGVNNCAHVVFCLVNNDSDSDSNGDSSNDGGDDICFSFSKG